MTFIPLALHTLEGVFVGYVIKGEHKLQSTNIYLETENDQLNEQLNRLNNEVDIRKFWPHPQDPEVVALLNDVNFMPVEMTETEVIDEDNSYLVYKKIARTGIEAEQLGQGWVDSNEVDEDASVIAYKKIEVPAKPTDTMWRIKQACERVAQRRLNQRAGVIESS